MSMLNRRGGVAIALAAVASLVGCDEGAPAPPPPPTSAAAATTSVEELRAELKKRAEEITPELSKAIKLAVEAKLDDTPCADTLDSQVKETYSEAAIVVTPALVKFAKAPSFEAPKTGFRPKAPAWTRTATGSLALLGKVGSFYRALEALAFTKTKYGADLMQKATGKALEELKQQWSQMPTLAIVVMPVGETQSEVAPGAKVKVDARTGDKSVAIKGGGAGARVTVVDLKEQKARCAFAVTATDTGGYGSGTARVSSKLISAMEKKLGDKGLFNPKR